MLWTLARGGTNPSRPGQGNFLICSLTFFGKKIISKLFSLHLLFTSPATTTFSAISMTTHLLFFRCFKLWLYKPLTWWLVFLLTAMLVILPSNAISSQYELTKMGPKLSRNNMKCQQYYQLLAQETLDLWFFSGNSIPRKERWNETKQTRTTQSKQKDQQK